MDESLTMYREARDLVEAINGAEKVPQGRLMKRRREWGMNCREWPRAEEKELTIEEVEMMVLWNLLKVFTANRNGF